MRKSKKINLRVPAGVDEGSRLRVRGEGNSGKKGGEYGDLYVFLNVKTDRGELLISKPIDPITLKAGHVQKFEVLTLDARCMVNMR